MLARLFFQIERSDLAVASLWRGLIVWRARRSSKSGGALLLQEHGRYYSVSGRYSILRAGSAMSPEARPARNAVA